MADDIWSLINEPEEAAAQMKAQALAQALRGQEWAAGVDMMTPYFKERGAAQMKGIQAQQAAIPEAAGTRMRGLLGKAQLKQGAEEFGQSHALNTKTAEDLAKDRAEQRKIAWYNAMTGRMGA